jgi:acetyltransferase-like isoleucine patch superfamily enzyme
MQTGTNNGFLTENEIKSMGFKKFGHNLKISNKSSIYGTKNIEIGNNVRIDDFCVISAGSGGIIIGSFIHISPSVNISGSGKIVLSDYVSLSVKTTILSSSDDFSGNYMTNPEVGSFDNTLTNVTNKDTYIGKHVVIGAHSLVLPGCNICDNCSIGAMTFVNKEITQMGIYVGTPVRFLKAIGTNRFELEKKIVYMINT